MSNLMSLKLLGLAIASIVIVSCAPEKEESKEKKYKRPTISIEQFDYLSTSDKNSLTRKAMAKDLGACTVVRYDSSRDSSGKYCDGWAEPYVVYLRDIKLYYPDMSRSSVSIEYQGCDPLDVRQYVWQALNDGFCYKVNR